MGRSNRDLKLGNYLISRLLTVVCCKPILLSGNSRLLVYIAKPFLPLINLTHPSNLLHALL